MSDSRTEDAQCQCDAMLGNGTHDVACPLHEPEGLKAASHKAVTDFVNAQNCQSKADVEAALIQLGQMAASALYVVRHGKSEKLS